MTELSDADLEMAAEIQAAFSGISKERALAVLRTEFNPSAMLAAARTNITAEILAAARVNERETRIVFDGPPGPKSGRFVEVEDANGTSFNAGEWHERPDGLWELRLHPSATLARLAAENQRMRRAIHSALTTLSRCPQIERGGGGMTIEAQIARSEINRVPARIIDDLYAALGDKP